MVKYAVNLGAVHTHTHTHTHGLYNYLVTRLVKNSKLYFAYPKNIQRLE